MTTTLKINNRDLAYTIDTYGMFTGDSFEESEREYYAEEYRLSPEQEQEFEFTYDHAGIVKDLASESINILWNELKGAIVHDINFVESGSPQFYNYTTDHYTAEWTVDIEQLQAYVANCKEEFDEFVSENWDYEYSKAVLEKDADTQTVVALDFWTRRILSEDQYNDQMFEREWEVYSNNTAPSEETQKMLDNQPKQEG